MGWAQERTMVVENDPIHREIIMKCFGSRRDLGIGTRVQVPGRQLPQCPSSWTDHEGRVLDLRSMIRSLVRCNLSAP